MSCNCPNYTTFDLIVNCFATAVALPITSASAEQLLGKIEFAGYTMYFYADVTEGGAIVIPNKFFNESALHILKLYRPNGDLLNNTCYEISLTIVAEPLPEEGIGSMIIGSTFIIS